MVFLSDRIRQGKVRIKPNQTKLKYLPTILQIPNFHKVMDPRCPLSRDGRGRDE